MTVSHMVCSSRAVTVKLLDLIWRSPLAPDLSPAPEKLNRSRKKMDFTGRLMPRARGVKQRDVSYGGVSCVQHQPRHAPSNRVVLYFHGGGYCVGSPDTHNHMVSRLAKRAAMCAVVPRYRKAPEHPYPAPLEDAVSVYQALLDEGIKPGNLYLAGDSAGGNLVLVLLLRLKQEGMPLPAAACCISPWTDMGLQGDTLNTKAKTDNMLNGDLLEHFAQLYTQGMAAEQRCQQPYLSPLAGDLAGLPPLLVQVGSEEVLLDDAVRLTEKAQQAGVAVELQIWEKMQHVWHLSFPVLKDGRLAILEIAEFFDRNQ
ncbi:MAG: alpha/beta hydrolase [Pseudomonadota bacterium]|nr:alpha/beta hydrolase [Pseudomonadota bacterium]